MKRKKIILVLLFASMAGSSHAQEKRELAPREIKDTLITYTFSGYERRVEEKWELVPPDFKDTVITYTFTVPELRVSRAFIDSLNTIILFDKKNDWGYSLLSASENTLRNFHLRFEQRDSVNYRIWVELDKNPGKRSAGFFEHNGYRYWFYRVSLPPGIVLETGPEKQFSYKEYKYQGYNPIYDPILWFVKYNRQTGQMEDNKMPFFD